MSHIPVQYNSKVVKASVVIANTQDDKDYAEEAKKTKGNVTFGPAMFANENLIYNLGYKAGVASIANLKIIHVPDLKTEDGTSVQSNKKF
ncbi:MAG: hypothetical protein K2Q45_06805 [Nitrosomonas sp.]|nr:hypothetical protein [Nitrosomonas sp.]